MHSDIHEIIILSVYTYRQCGVDYPRDTVIVHQLAKGKYVPSLGHFVVKLETYLRMANIKYEVCGKLCFSLYLQHHLSGHLASRLCFDVI